ncbi:hypothetical protein BKA62DRAFT_782338 [Auriculariales sp. MPI-PUGE-AT-0066]|nr:hypothetical protein BKA62DRAFT_782338 [Auriculariales sp. MPI-PUGE-AT-0066]
MPVIADGIFNITLTHHNNDNASEPVQESVPAPDGYVNAINFLDLIDENGSLKSKGTSNNNLPRLLQMQLLVAQAYSHTQPGFCTALLNYVIATTDTPYSLRLNYEAAALRNALALESDVMSVPSVNIYASKQVFSAQKHASDNRMSDALDVVAKSEGAIKTDTFMLKIRQREYDNAVIDNDNASATFSKNQSDLDQLRKNFEAGVERFKKAEEIVAVKQVVLGIVEVVGAVAPTVATFGAAAPVAAVAHHRSSTQSGTDSPRSGRISSLSLKAAGARQDYKVCRQGTARARSSDVRDRSGDGRRGGRENALRKRVQRGCSSAKAANSTLPPESAREARNSIKAFLLFHLTTDWILCILMSLASTFPLPGTSCPINATQVGDIDDSDKGVTHLSAQDAAPDKRKHACLDWDELDEFDEPVSKRGRWDIESALRTASTCTADQRQLNASHITAVSTLGLRPSFPDPLEHEVVDEDDDWSLSPIWRQTPSRDTEDSSDNHTAPGRPTAPSRTCSEDFGSKGSVTPSQLSPCFGEDECQATLAHRYSGASGCVLD